MKTRWMWAAVGILAAAGGLAQGATLADLELRDLWLGEPWDAASLKDRTVVVEFWGYN